MWRLYKTGIGLTTEFIRSHTVTHNYSVYTLTASQFTIVLAESSYCVFWRSRLQLLQPTLLASLAITSHNWLEIVRSLLSMSELYSPGTDHKENTVSDSKSKLLSSTVVWRHYRNGLQRKQQFLPLLHCLATVVNKRFHCWLLTYSVHVTIPLFCYTCRHSARSSKKVSIRKYNKKQ
jgi:hypothetical protein